MLKTHKLGTNVQAETFRIAGTASHFGSTNVYRHVKLGPADTCSLI